MRQRPDFDDAALVRAARILARDHALAQEIGPVEPLVPRPLPRAAPRRSWRRRVAGRTVGAAAVIALLSVLASERRLADPPLADQAAFVPRYAAPAVAPPVWSEVAADRYRLGEATGSARTQPGLREDTLTAGAFAVQEAPFLRLVAVETAEPDGEGSLFVTLARRAAEAGGLSVVRTGERGQLATRFGALDTVDATLADAEGRRACTAFRLGASLRLEGWFCAPLGQLPEPQALACTVERLSPVPGAGLSPAIAAMLAQARTASCPPEEPTTTAAVPTPRKPARTNAARVRHSRPASP
ncbi:hypothetical protein [Methylobacterium frigidaeris]|uniref:Uncharacterized protein n=1 Tax=Methylobacterium frigidaeris TaxID=2038277 RepID=A0AA37M6Y0_9HYPH|nr:hypothetical protein [Methylobacterium frigidaeris]PIK70859.1 hypothetical protein CS379_22455 [Methylobacterium frigidaeris]GJD65050.1 hypothetical protein MPEAHAMD_5236 [Methylobacterium frigidaeris]